MSLDINVDKISDILGPDFRRQRRAVFVARGHPGNRWYLDGKGEWVLRDEYAENIPEALIDLCQKLGWVVTVIYSGRAPEFSETKKSYTKKYPGLVTELSFTDINYPLSREKAAAKEWYEKQLKTFQEAKTFQELFTYRGINFTDHLSDRIARDVPNLSANMIGLYKLWSQVFEFIKPELIIGGRMDVMPYLVSAAREQNVVCANIKLGIGEEMLFPLAVNDAQGQYAQECAPDVSLLWGGAQKTLIENRFPDYPSELVVSGRTRNDTFAAPVPKEDIAAGRKQLGLKENENVISFGGTHRTFYGMGDDEISGTSCMSPYAMRSTLEALTNSARKRGNTVVIVKPHPVDDLNMIENICKDIGRPLKYLAPDAGIHNSVLLEISDIFVSSVSSMFTEAISADCLPINLWIDDVNYLYEEARRDVWGNLSVTVESIEALIEQCEFYLDNPDEAVAKIAHYMSVLPNYAGPADGQNSRRAVLGAMDAVHKIRPIKDYQKHVQNFIV